MNYTVCKTDDGYFVTEFPSLLIMKSSKNEGPMKKLADKLNSGTGFDGFTPPFFVNRKILTINLTRER